MRGQWSLDLEDSGLEEPRVLECSSLFLAWIPTGICPSVHMSVYPNVHPSIYLLGRLWKGKRTWNVFHHSLYGYLQVFVYLSICLSIYMSIYLSIYPYGRAKGPGMFFIIPCMDTYRYLSICPYVCLSICLSIYLSTWKTQVWKSKRIWNVLYLPCMDTYRYLSIYPNVCLSKCPSICLLSIHLKTQVWKDKRAWKFLHHSLHGYL